MHTLIYTTDDSAFAARLAADTRRAGYTLNDSPPGKPDNQDAHVSALVAVVSPAALRDAAFMTKLDAGMDAGLHLLVVFEQPIDLPKAINHVETFDFSGGIDVGGLGARLEAIQTGAAGLALRTRTPAVRKANRQTAAILAVMVFGMFAAGIYGVGVMGLQAPRDEYDAVDTMEAMTIQAYTVPELEQYARMIPAAGSDADFAATLRSIPTAYRPFVAGTATAFSEGTPIIVPTAITVTPESDGS
jgi:hypothetical protein